MNNYTSYSHFNLIYLERPEPKNILSEAEAEFQLLKATYDVLNCCIIDKSANNGEYKI